MGCALEALSRVPDGQAEIFACADNFHGRIRGITGFSTDAAAREHFGSFALARALEEWITTSFGNNWQAIDIARELLTIFSKCALKSLHNQAGFDSAIRRFDPSRPSQPFRHLGQAPKKGEIGPEMPAFRVSDSVSELPVRGT